LSGDRAHWHGSGPKLHDPLRAWYSEWDDQADNRLAPEVALSQATERTGMEIGRGSGISSKRWTEVSGRDFHHGAPDTVFGLAAPRYQAAERTGRGSHADDCKTPGESQSPGDKALAASRCPVTGLSVQDRNYERQ
jgi:hypothetical protein